MLPCGHRFPRPLFLVYRLPAVPPLPKIAVIGIGDDGLDAAPPAIRSRILESQVILGSDRALGLLPADCGAERQTLSGDLDELATQLAALGDRRAVVLSFGDPMFYGLARYVTEKVGKDRFEVVPHVSSMQLAFARVMESWDEAYLTNLDNHPTDAVVERIRTAPKAGLFTSAKNSPDAFAKAMLAKGIDYFNAYVCENLAARDERVNARLAAGDRRAEVRPAERDDPRPPGGRAGPAARPGRAAAVRQPRRGVLALPAQAGAGDLGRGAGAVPAQMDVAPGALCGTSAPGAAR